MYLLLGVMLGFFLYRESVGRFLMWSVGGIFGKMRKIAIKLLKKNNRTVRINSNNENLRRRRRHDAKKN